MNGYDTFYSEYARLEEEEEEEEIVRIKKPQIDYAELDDVDIESVEDLDLCDFFIEKKLDCDNRCHPSRSSSTAQPERTEIQPLQIPSASVSVHQFME